MYLVKVNIKGSTSGWVSAAADVRTKLLLLQMIAWSMIQTATQEGRQRGAASSVLMPLWNLQENCNEKQQQHGGGLDANHSAAKFLLDMEQDAKEVDLEFPSAISLRRYHQMRMKTGLYNLRLRVSLANEIGNLMCFLVIGSRENGGRQKGRQQLDGIKGVSVTSTLKQTKSRDEEGLC